MTRGPKPAADGSVAAPSPEKPVAPEWLHKEAKRYFALLVVRLDDMGAASATHTEMLTLCAMRLADVERLGKIIAEKGSSYDTYTADGHPCVKARPEYAQLSEAQRHAAALLEQMGLSLAAMGRIKIVPAGPGGKTGFEESE